MSDSAYHYSNTEEEGGTSHWPKHRPESAFHGHQDTKHGEYYQFQLCALRLTTT